MYASMCLCACACVSSIVCVHVSVYMHVSVCSEMYVCVSMLGRHAPLDSPGLLWDSRSYFCLPSARISGLATALSCDLCTSSEDV